MLISSRVSVILRSQGEYARADELQFGDCALFLDKGLFDDEANPALRLQTGWLSGPDTPNFIAADPRFSLSSADGDKLGALID